MNILDKITDTEYEQMNNWRRDNIGTSSEQKPFVSSRTLLSMSYASAKQDLFKMFDEELILSRPFSLEVSTNQIIHNLHNNDPEGIFHAFRRIFINKLNRIMTGKGCLPIESDRIYRIMDNIFSYAALANNAWANPSVEIPYFVNDKTLKVHVGMKITSILKKLAKAWDLEKDFERFRIWHSQILNTKAFHGTLHLSIHPLDYMTMSDNAYGWSSCMSWNGNGCYRQGTVEMMNSPYVVVAYLTGSNDKFSVGGYNWSNKKWRSLYIVHDACIASVKNYPYQDYGIDKTVLEWLRDLAVNNLNKEYEDILYKWGEDLEIVTFETGYMYNDFGALDFHYMYLNPHMEGRTYIYYSGDSQCMYCGETDIDIEENGYLLCRYCDEYYYCSECGEFVGYQDSYWVNDEDDNTRRVCCDCYQNLDIVTCNCCNSHYRIEDIHTVYILESKSSSSASKYIYYCPSCLGYHLKSGEVSTSSDNDYYIYRDRVPCWYYQHELDHPKVINIF